jgi:hypothetical protein
MAKRITLHVPEELPDGSPVEVARFEAYERALFELARRARGMTDAGEEGFTLIRGAVGTWRSPDGVTFREPMRLYCLDVADADEVLDDLRSLSERIQAELNQEAIYLTIAPIDVLLITGLVHV